MTRTFVPAMIAAAALAVGFSGAVVAGQANAVSPESAVVLKAAVEAQQAKNVGQTISKANEALANSKKTPYDTYVAYQLLAWAYDQQKNPAEVQKAMQGQLDTGMVPAAQAAQLRRHIFNLYYQQKQYDKAIEAGTELIRNGQADPQVYSLVGQSYALQNKHAEAARFFQSLVSEQEKRGQKPAEHSLLMLRDSYSKMGNNNAAQEAIERLVVHHPKPLYWDNLLFSLRTDPKINERQSLHVYRLMQATNTLKRGVDYTDLADLAANAGMPGEGHRVLESGLAANAFKAQSDADRAKRLLASTKRQADSELASLPKLEAEAAKSGEAGVTYGMALFGNAEYAKAATVLSAALQKGGLKNPVDAQILLGVAQLRANARADAMKTFQAVKSDDVLWQRIAKVWTLYLK